MQRITHLLYGTGNEDKVDKLRKWMQPTGITLLSPKALGYYQIVPEETDDIQENARQKAEHYFHTAGMPVFCIATALELEGVQPQHQPGTQIRNRGGMRWDSEQIIEYYTWLAEQYGGALRARFCNAVCLMISEQHIFEQAGFDSADFLIVNHPHKKWRRKDPLAALIQDERTGECWLDKESFWEYDHAKEKFQQFILESLKKWEELK